MSDISIDVKVRGLDDQKLKPHITELAVEMAHGLDERPDQDWVTFSNHPGDPWGRPVAATAVWDDLATRDKVLVIVSFFPPSAWANRDGYIRGIEKELGGIKQTMDTTLADAHNIFGSKAKA